PIIIMTIAVADCVHILVSYFFATEHGLKKHDAIVESLRVNLRPVFITSLTTVIGFMTMNFSDVPPFNVLGNAAATGVAIAFVLSVTLLPALMAVLPLHTRKTDIEGAGRMTPFAHHVMNHRRAYTWGVGGLAILMLALAPNNEVNDQFVKYYDESREFRYSTDFANEHLSSVYDITYTLATEPDGIYEPDYLRQVEAFEQYLLAQPEVVNVQSIAHTFRRLNKSMHGDDPAWYKLPEDRELAAQYFLLYEMSLPFGLDASNQISFDKSASRVQITLKEQTTQEMLDLEDKYSAWLAQNTPDLTVNPAGVMLMFSHIGVENAASMIAGTVFALLMMSLVIGIALRSVKMGMVSLVANVVPAGMAFGVWSLYSGQVGLSIAVAIGMTLGIVVDNTVHLLSKFQLSLNEKSPRPEDAVVYAFSHVGVALLICNCVLVAGFMILSQSDFKLNGDLGLFTSLTFVLALVVDFLLVPPLLLKLFRGQGQVDGVAPVVQSAQ
ncbi:MAG: efflux RND transporter permease subunit, partial [Alcanivoracaceae bacterium]